MKCYFKVLNHSLAVEGAQFWVTTGMQFAPDRLYVGQSSITITNSGSVSVSLVSIRNRVFCKGMV